MAKVIGIAILILLVGLTAAENEDSFFLNPFLIKVFQKCASNGVVLNPSSLDAAKSCLEPTVMKAQEYDPQSVKPIETFCKFLPDVTSCYDQLFDMAERCAPEWVGNPRVFRLSEILENLGKALCAEEKDPRIKNILILGEEGMKATLCYMLHRDAIFSDFGESAVAKRLIENPFELLKADTCGIVDEIEDTLVDALDLCEDPESATRFARQVLDIVGGLAFKCEAHRNF